MRFLILSFVSTAAFADCGNKDIAGVVKRREERRAPWVNSAERRSIELLLVEEGDDSVASWSLLVFLAAKSWDAEEARDEANWRDDGATKPSVELGMAQRARRMASAGGLLCQVVLLLLPRWLIVASIDSSRTIAI